MNPADLLRRLPADGFVPPPDLAPWSASSRAAAFAADVEAFAAAFWSLAPADRRARFDALAKRRTGAAAAWLEELEPGLDVVPVAQSEPRAAELSALLQNLFTLSPGARAAKRLAWLRDGDHRGRNWAAATRALLRTDLPLARLEPRVFEWTSANRSPTPVAAAPTAAPPVGKSDFPAPPSGSACLNWMIGLIVTAVVLLVALVLVSTVRAVVLRLMR